MACHVNGTHLVLLFEFPHLGNQWLFHRTILSQKTVMHQRFNGCVGNIHGYTHHVEVREPISKPFGASERNATAFFPSLWSVQPDVDFAIVEPWGLKERGGFGEALQHGFLLLVEKGLHGVGVVVDKCRHFAHVLDEAFASSGNHTLFL